MRRQGGPGRTERQGAAGCVLHDAFPVTAEDSHWRRSQISDLVPLFGGSKGTGVPRSAFAQGGRQLYADQPSF